MRGVDATCTTVQTIDSPDDDFAGGIQTVASESGAVTVELPSPSIVWVRFVETCEPTR